MKFAAIAGFFLMVMSALALGLTGPGWKNGPAVDGPG